ncbi:MAG: ABC transporter ATP-binding protein [Candidatus Hodarchaeales archaeon]|jgi:ATP-binding cassette subfamily B protein
MATVDQNKTTTPSKITEFIPPIDYRTNKQSPIRWIRSHIFRYKIYFIPIILLQLFATVSQALIPILIGSVVNTYLENYLTTNRLLFLSFLILLVGVGAGFFNLLKAWLMEILAQRIERNARDELYSSLLGKSLTFHDGQSIGDIMARASTDVRQLNFALNPGFLLVFSAATGIVIPFIFIAFINFQLLIIPFLFLISYLIALRSYNKNLGKVAFRQRILNSKINSRLNEAVSGMYLVRGMAQENKEKSIFQRNTGDFKENTIEQGKIMARYYPLLLLGVATVLALFHGLWLVNEGVIDTGQLVAFMLLIQLLRFPTFINIFAFTLVSLGVASARRILELINADTEIDSNPKGYNQVIQGNISFENVTFGYNEKSVINDISFKVKPGQTVAIIGMTGSGKTTITKLLTRLYNPQKGNIIIDGVSIKDWSIHGLRNQMALVEQDIFLFSKSIKDNIKFGAQNASDDEIIEAAKLAQAHTFIQDLPKGYDTVVGERGVTLSGGQRQRVAIARAILCNPRILILDDASSAIDSRTEDEINQAIKSVLKDRVSFLITHRIAQIRRADLIILIEKGKIINKGDHEELLKESPLYRAIFSSFDDFEQTANTEGF